MNKTDKTFTPRLPLGDSGNSGRLWGILEGLTKRIILRKSKKMISNNEKNELCRDLKQREGTCSKTGPKPIILCTSASFFSASFLTLISELLFLLSDSSSTRFSPSGLWCPSAVQTETSRPFWNPTAPLWNDSSGHFGWFYHICHQTVASSPLAIYWIVLMVRKVPWDFHPWWSDVTSCAS